MWIPTIVMGGLAVGLAWFSYWQGKDYHIEGTKTAAVMVVQVLPLLFFAFVVAAIVQSYIPKDTLSAWVGVKSGWRGLLVGTVAGGFCPGGPFVTMPIALVLVRAGAGVGTIVAFLTAWSLWGISRLPIELGFLGWKLAAIRFGTTFFFPPIAGALAHVLFGNLHVGK